MTSIGWLHLSDLHWTLRRAGWEAPHVKERVLQDLQEVHERTGPWDLVIVSGDLSTLGSPEELEAASESLERLLCHARKLGSDPWLLAVPGNHDIARPSEPSAAALRAMRSWHDDPGVRDEFWNDPTSPARRLVDRAFEPFDRWWRAREIPAASDSATRKVQRKLRQGVLAGDFTATLEVDGVRLGVAGLNSAFLQNTGDDYTRRLAMDPHQLRMAAGGDVPAWVAEHDVAILVTHHAPDWLSEELNERYETAINPAGRFCAHLCGHVHDPKPAVERGPRPKIRCPSFFGIDTWEDRRGRHGSRECGYNAARLDFKRRTLTVCPRTWDGDRPRVLESELPLNVDRFPRPTVSPLFTMEAAALRDALAAVYPTKEGALRFAEIAGLKVERGTGGSAADLWHVLVGEAARRGPQGLAALVESVKEEGPGGTPLAEAWDVYRKASDRKASGGAKESLRVHEVQRGGLEENLADLLYEKLASLPPPAFASVLSALAIIDEIPGEDAPQTARAVAVVRRAERDGMPGLERLLAAVLHALGRSPAPALKAGSAMAADTWLPLLLVLLGGMAVGAGIGMLVAGSGTSKTSRQRSPTRATLAKLLTVMFSDERDFDGFVLDHFPSTYRRFSTAMTRSQRIALLLEGVDVNEVVSRLRRAHPSAFNAHERVLDYEEGNEPRDPYVRTRAR